MQTARLSDIFAELDIYGASRLEMVPTSQERTRLKTRLLRLWDGVQLLHKQSDALKFRLIAAKEKRDFLVENIQVRQKNIRFLEARVRRAAGGQLNTLPAINAANRIFYPEVSKPNPLLGREVIELPDLPEPVSDLKLLGLARGATLVRDLMDANWSLHERLQELNETVQSCKDLEKKLKQVDRRHNAIKSVVMPKVARTYIYISGELDEREREEFRRIKLGLQKKALALQGDAS